MQSSVVPIPFERILLRGYVAVIFSVLLPTVLLSHFSDRSERCFEACQEQLAECVSSSNSKSED